MNSKFNFLIILVFSITLSSCSKKKAVKSISKNEQIEQPIHAVSYSDFAKFVEATGYVTDAERYDWSIVQQDVFNFNVVDGANWKKPDGVHVTENQDLPITQVSYNDAITYCKWTNTRLPSYDEYWLLIKSDKRKVVTDNNSPISNVEDVNLLGNVWEITEPVSGNSIRLAGGSLFCSESTCYGTSEDRELYTDKETGNIHIGFAVISLSSSDHK